jgi:predicted lipoprotein with Yx(FWY)xxD motif
VVALGVAATLGAAAAALASCGGQGLASGPNGTVAAATSSTVAARTIRGLGRVLVTSSGVTLYLLTSDPPGGSNCTGSCAIVWPPLEAKGRLKAGPGVDPALLSTVERSDGIRQVLYAKHALYTYQDDTTPGMATGQGVETYGGIWWVVAPSGKAITNGAAAGAATT